MNFVSTALACFGSGFSIHVVSPFGYEPFGLLAQLKPLTKTFKPRVHKRQFTVVNMASTTSTTFLHNS